MIGRPKCIITFYNIIHIILSIAIISGRCCNDRIPFIYLTRNYTKKHYKMQHIIVALLVVLQLLQLLIKTPLIVFVSWIPSFVSFVQCSDFDPSNHFV